MARQSQMVSHVKWGVRIENTFGKNLTPAGVRFPKKTLFFFWPPPPDVLKVYYSYKVSLTVHVCDWLLRYSDQWKTYTCNVDATRVCFCSHHMSDSLGKMLRVPPTSQWLFSDHARNFGPPESSTNLKRPSQPTTFCLATFTVWYYRYILNLYYRVCRAKKKTGKKKKPKKTLLGLLAPNKPACWVCYYCHTEDGATEWRFCQYARVQ